MSYEKQKKIFDILLPILIIITGIAYIAGAAHLYFTGGSEPYSRETVGAYLGYLAIPSLITLIATVWSGVIPYLTAGNDERVSAFTSKIALKRLNEKLDLEKCSEGTAAGILAVRKKRKLFIISAAALSLVYAVSALIFALGVEYKLDGKNEVVIGALAVLLPLTAVIIGIVYLFYCLYQQSILSELELVRLAIKDGASCDGSTKSNEKCALSRLSSVFEKHEGAIVLGLKIAVFAAAAIFIALGIENGGMADVLGKAVRICTECIGLG